MRRFNEKEKSIIQLLLKGVADSDAYLPINVYNDIFYREHVEFDVQKMQLVFMFLKKPCLMIIIKKC